MTNQQRIDEIIKEALAQGYTTRKLPVNGQIYIGGSKMTSGFDKQMDAWNVELWQLQSDIAEPSKEQA